MRETIHPVRIVYPCRIIALAVAIAIALKVFVLDIVIVQGRSMLPTLVPGDVVLVVKAYYGLRSPLSGRYWLRWHTPQPGDLVVVQQPNHQLDIIKRCDTVHQNEVFVLGDNYENSIDSRAFGPVSRDMVRGKALPFPGVSLRALATIAP